MVISIKQHLSNNWSSIHDTQHPHHKKASYDPDLTELDSPVVHIDSFTGLRQPADQCGSSPTKIRIYKILLLAFVLIVLLMRGELLTFRINKDS